ncbi:unnamed protein product [Lampetra planeri]
MRLNSPNGRLLLWVTCVCLAVGQVASIVTVCLLVVALLVTLGLMYHEHCRRRVYAQPNQAFDSSVLDIGSYENPLYENDLR